MAVIIGILILLGIGFCMGHNYLWAVVMFGIAAYIIHSLIEENKKPAPVNYDHYWNLESEIMHECYDNHTDNFDWDKWFDRRDEIIHTAPPKVLEGIDSDFRHFGDCQVRKINQIIQNWILFTEPFDPAQGLRELKRQIVDTGILTNFPSLYSHKNGEYEPSICPQKVLDYQKLVSDVVYQRDKNADKRKYESIVELGREITN